MAIEGERGRANPVMHDATQPVTPSDLAGSAPPAQAQTTDLSGQSIGDFQIIRRLGQGGMGHVYLAEQRSLKRKVALKFLRSDLVINATTLNRFRREAEAVARVTHANIVQVYSINSEVVAVLTWPLSTSRAATCVSI